jgi:ribosomal protein L32
MPPKRKLTRPRTRRRYATYRSDAKKRIANYLQIVPCSLCGSPKISHHLCSVCSGYGHPKGKKKQVGSTDQVAKSTEVKAAKPKKAKKADEAKVDKPKSAEEKVDDKN